MIVTFLLPIGGFPVMQMVMFKNREETRARKGKDQPTSLSCGIVG
jgi:hypothetical protein